MIKNYRLWKTHCFISMFSRSVAATAKTSTLLFFTHSTHYIILCEWMRVSFSSAMTFVIVRCLAMNEWNNNNRNVTYHPSENKTAVNSNEIVIIIGASDTFSKVFWCFEILEYFFGFWLYEPIFSALLASVLRDVCGCDYRCENRFLI
jgi:hypothetical protein